METERAISLPNIESLDILTPERGLVLFQELNLCAEEHLANSKNELTAAFVALDLIREHMLFSYGGYNDWRGYLNDFLDQNGTSRSLGYENLAIVRIARASTFSAQDILDYGLYTIKPFFERGSPVLDYDRATGEIKELAQNVEEMIPPGDSLGERYGTWVKEYAEQGAPGRIVRQNLREVTNERTFKFAPYYANDRWCGLHCYMENPDGTYEEKFIYFAEPAEMSDLLRFEMFNRLKVHKDFIE
jgi:hypothetical protein